VINRTLILVTLSVSMALAVAACSSDHARSNAQAGGEQVTVAG
jgi:hypothetical protein